MKRFISISPFQPKLLAGIYEPANDEKLRYDTPSSFPIIPVINAYAEPGESVQVITVVADYENTKNNYKALRSAISDLAAKKGIEVDFKEVKIPFISTLNVQLDIFQQIISNISDGDQLFCDITYGTKVMSQILTMSVNYGYRVCSDVMVGCIVYGERDFISQKMKIYDITSLTYMDEITRLMADNKVSDPVSRIRTMLNWGENDA